MKSLLSWLLHTWFPAKTPPPRQGLYVESLVAGAFGPIGRRTVLLVTARCHGRPWPLVPRFPRRALVVHHN